MPIPVRDDIREIAPRIAEAAVLWLRDGYNLRHSTWQRLRETYGERLHPQAVNHPWLAQADVLLELQPPDRRLRWVYVFAHPDDAHGCADEQEVQQRVAQSLNQLAEMGVASVALIHIPLSRGGQAPTAQDDGASARAMVEAATAWEQGHPEAIVFLVDLQGAFAQVLP